jgi:hypothetical protein
MTRIAIAQAKAASSRAMATVMTLIGLPVCWSRRKRAQSRTRAFQAIALTVSGRASLRASVNQHRSGPRGRSRSTR